MSGMTTPTDVSRECQKAKQCVIMPDEQTHDEREQRRDGRGRDRVRVEDLEQLNVRRDDGDEVAAVAALELRGAETAQCAEDLVADQRKQLEGDEVVAGLLGVAEDAAH